MDFGLLPHSTLYSRQYSLYIDPETTISTLLTPPTHQFMRGRDGIELEKIHYVSMLAMFRASLGVEAMPHHINCINHDSLYFC